MFDQYGVRDEACPISTGGRGGGDLASMMASFRIATNLRRAGRVSAVPPKGGL